MQHYQLPQEKVKHFVVVIGTIFLLTINMCDRGRTITHLQIPRFHTQVWYNPKDVLSCDLVKFRGREICSSSYRIDLKFDDNNLSGNRWQVQWEPTPAWFIDTYVRNTDQWVDKIYILSTKNSLFSFPWLLLSHAGTDFKGIC